MERNPAKASTTGRGPSRCHRTRYCWRDVMIATIEHDGVRELRLNRPPANALSPELIAALKRAVESPGQGIGALVLSGSPGMFSAGLDVPLLLTLDRAQMAEMWREFYALLRALACSPIPIAAAMRSTMARARADLAGLFNQDLDREIAEAAEMWWSPEVQAALRAFAERLGKKRE